MAGSFPHDKAEAEKRKGGREGHGSHECSKQGTERLGPQSAQKLESQTPRKNVASQHKPWKAHIHARPGV